jgi:glutathione S-transferase
MHSGFGNLRTLCGMNIEASLADVGAQLLKDNPGLQGEVDRIAQMWTDLLDAHGGPMLFGEFTNADAYFAPVGTRIKTYGLPVPPSISAYIERVQALPGIKAWIDDALAEKDFLPFEEPYRKGR